MVSTRIKRLGGKLALVGAITAIPHSLGTEVIPLTARRETTATVRENLPPFPISTSPTLEEEVSTLVAKYKRTHFGKGATSVSVRVWNTSAPPYVALDVDHERHTGHFEDRGVFPLLRRDLLEKGASKTNFGNYLTAAYPGVEINRQGNIVTDGNSISNVFENVSDIDNYPPTFRSWHGSLIGRLNTKVPNYVRFNSGVTGGVAVGDLKTSLSSQDTRIHYIRLYDNTTNILVVVNKPNAPSTWGRKADEGIKQFTEELHRLIFNQTSR